MLVAGCSLKTTARALTKISSYKCKLLQKSVLTKVPEAHETLPNIACEGNKILRRPPDQLPDTNSHCCFVAMQAIATRRSHTVRWQ